jgi:hypothetical protein
MVKLGIMATFGAWASSSGKANSRIFKIISLVARAGSDSKHKIDWLVENNNATAPAGNLRFMMMNLQNIEQPLSRRSSDISASLDSSNNQWKSQ